MFAKPGIPTNKNYGIVLLFLTISGTLALLPEDGEQSNGNWMSHVSDCFTGESSFGAHQSVCQQLRAVDDCCQRNADYTGAVVGCQSELNKMLVNAVSQTRNRFCKGELPSNQTNSTSRIWDCNSELETLFGLCLGQLVHLASLPFEAFSFVECHLIYSMQHCASNELLNCRSPILLDIFNRFQRNLLAKTPCVELENANEPAA
ncbi:uncharacterized protein LOC110675564 [Aedes aegypti]|uniref:Uncharacterized protein n=1 Tax=Aedes aegypti TaxID=7159 RepID=A0A6I8U680_AEDAE|nr:uncharacterized protein LOC110675564 [Aedes aegypti]